MFLSSRRIAHPRSTPWSFIAPSSTCSMWLLRFLDLSTVVVSQPPDPRGTAGSPTPFRHARRPPLAAAHQPLASSCNAVLLLIGRHNSCLTHFVVGKPTKERMCTFLVCVVVAHCYSYTRPGVSTSCSTRQCTTHLDAIDPETLFLLLLLLLRAECNTS
ncbi:hypothetical protein BJX63DRAFT_285347 [Aspergillus granulosus]|uniref:Uncharacterized protein n=1 Tax=Aspergillus granulosus TaxID=176169 RepID=A0ABR4H731_9EURO